MFLWDPQNINSYFSTTFSHNSWCHFLIDINESSKLFKFIRSIRSNLCNIINRDQLIMHINSDNEIIQHDTFYYFTITIHNIPLFVHIEPSSEEELGMAASSNQSDQQPPLKASDPYRDNRSANWISPSFLPSKMIMTIVRIVRPTHHVPDYLIAGKVRVDQRCGCGIDGFHCRIYGNFQSTGISVMSALELETVLRHWLFLFFDVCLRFALFVDFFFWDFTNLVIFGVFMLWTSGFFGFEFWKRRTKYTYKKCIS